MGLFCLGGYPFYHGTLHCVRRTGTTRPRLRPITVRVVRRSRRSSLTSAFSCCCIPAFCISNIGIRRNNVCTRRIRGVLHSTLRWAAARCRKRVGYWEPTFSQHNIPTPQATICVNRQRRGPCLLQRPPSTSNTYHTQAHQEKTNTSHPRPLSQDQNTSKGFSHKRHPHHRRHSSPQPTSKLYTRQFRKSQPQRPSQKRTQGKTRNNHSQKPSLSQQFIRQNNSHPTQDQHQNTKHNISLRLQRRRKAKPRRENRHHRLRSLRSQHVNKDNHQKKVRRTQERNPSTRVPQRSIKQGLSKGVIYQSHAALFHASLKNVRVQLTLPPRSNQHHIRSTTYHQPTTGPSFSG